MTAALVGVGGTVVVAVAGYWANVCSTKQTIAHDGESKVWDQRAAVYVEALAALNYRQVSRDAVIRLTDDAGTRQSRSCGLKQLERPLRVAGVVAVGGGDVDVAVQAQEADGQTAQ